MSPNVQALPRAKHRKHRKRRRSTEDMLGRCVAKNTTTNDTSVCE